MHRPQDYDLNKVIGDLFGILPRVRRRKRALGTLAIAYSDYFDKRLCDGIIGRQRHRLPAYCERWTLRRLG